MTELLERDLAADEPVQPPVEPGPPAETELAPVPVGATALAAVLACLAAAVPVAALFRGWLPFAVGLLAVLAGAAPAALAQRTGRPVLQYAAVPVAAVLGAVLLALDASGKGSANLPSLVVEAVRGGGVLQPPVAFDPGWRFLLTLLLAFVTAGALSLAFALRRPRLAVVVPLPLAMGAELLVPASREIPVTAVAVVLVVAALGIAYTASLRTEGVVVSGGFQSRRLLRGTGLVLALVATVVLLPQLSFLFPQPNRDRVTPPQRPPTPPPVADRVLFTFESPNRTAPLRLGVIDVYDQQEQAWLLPPYDTKRFVAIGEDGAVPGAAAKGRTYDVTVRVSDVPGHVLPSVAGFSRLATEEQVQYDPRTGVPQLPNRRLFPGLTYRMTVPVPPTGAQLAAAPAPPDRLAEFLEAPPVPNEVAVLLAKAPKSRFDRLQVLRDALLRNVVAAGVGKPTDLPVARVVAMLRGAEANPYEITAAEALLARWAGLPSRIGYGYYSGDKLGAGRYEIRPRHGATWLETYYEGYGWVPVVGVPRKAKSSTSDQEKNASSLVRPSDEVTLTIYVPTRERNVLQQFQVVWFWLRRIVPAVLGAAVVVYAYPAALKALRRRRRRRWAARHGELERILVSYAEFRDKATDLTFADPQASPLEYLEAIEPDEEHEELAWLVTRAAWGDLSRDLLPYDAERAELLARSVTRRLVRAQSGLNVALAYAARSSLREPWTREVPNLWWPQRPSRPREGAQRRPRFALRPLALLLAVLSLGGCGNDPQFRGPTVLRPGLTPAAVGNVQVVRKDALAATYRKAGPNALVTTGQVWTLEHHGVIEGTVQISLLKPDVRADDPEVRAGIDEGFGGAPFTRKRLVPDRIVWQKDLVDVRVYLWFPPRANAVELVVLRKKFAQHKQLVTALLDFQEGRRMQPLTVPPPVVTPAAEGQQLAPFTPLDAPLGARTGSPPP